jgi:hypothetical protein
MSGYIKLYRGWRDTDGLMPSKEFSDLEAWLWLLENASWKARTRFNGKGEQVDLQRGQMHVSVRSLCTAFGWSRKRVVGFLARIEAVNKVVTKRGQSGTILTVCNYDKYQSVGDCLGDSQGTVRGQSGDTQEESKEGKERKRNTRAGALTCPSGVSETVWRDFLEVRKAKRAPMTEIALAAIKREAQLAGWPLEDVLKECCARGWQGFKAEWMQGKLRPGGVGT